MKRLIEELKNLAKPTAAYEDTPHGEPKRAAEIIEGNMMYLGMDDTIIALADSIEEQHSLDQSTITQQRRVVDELLLRVADAYDQISIAVRETGRDDGFRSVLEHALKGDPGHIEPEEFEKNRQRALREHGPRLGWGEPVVVSVPMLTDDIGVWMNVSQGHYVFWRCPECHNQVFCWWDEEQEGEARVTVQKFCDHEFDQPEFVVLTTQQIARAVGARASD